MELFTGSFGRVVNKSEAGVGVDRQQVIGIQRLAAFSIHFGRPNWSPFELKSWGAGE
jgi:hypothetical protein